MAADEESSRPRPEKGGELPTISGPEAVEGHGVAEPVPKIEGYEITGKLGEGGVGTVWRAVQLSTRREVALKLLGSAAFRSDKARMRFEREVELAARLGQTHDRWARDSPPATCASITERRLTANPA